MVGLRAEVGVNTVINVNRRFQIDQKKANIAQILLLREICALFAVFFLFIIEGFRLIRRKQILRKFHFRARFAHYLPFSSDS